MSYFLDRDIPIKLPQFSNSDGGSVSIGLFENMTHLEEIDLSGFNLSVMTDAGCMFRNCSNLKYVDYTTSVFSPTVTKEMFANCSSITELDFKSRFKFDASTGKLQNCSGMFLNCTSLRTIWSYKDEPWKVTSGGLSANMFKGCTSLVGATSRYSAIGNDVLSNNNYGIAFAHTGSNAYALLKYR